jgi:hypothetical protein
VHVVLRGNPRDLLWALVLCAGAGLVWWLAHLVVGAYRARVRSRIDGTEPPAAVDGPGRDQSEVRLRR